MKGLYTLFLLFFSCALVSGQGIEFFEGDWKDALEQAKKEEKLVFVDAYAKWCGPCKRMAKNVFTLQEVGDFYNENFINLKLDMEEGQGREFGKLYPVSAYPTMFYLDGDGEIVKKLKGARQAEDLISLGENALKSVDYTSKYETEYASGNRDFSLVYNYLNALSKAGKPTLKVANEYLKNHDQDITKEQRLKIVFIGSTEADSKMFEEMVASKSEISAIVGEEAFNEAVARACQNTVNKAIEYEYPDLLDEAIDKMKKAKTAGAKAFAYTAKMDYYLAYKEMDTYLSLAKTYVKKFGKQDPTLYKEISEDLFNTSFENVDCQKFAFELGEKLIKAKPTENSYMHYLSLLVQAQRHEEAFKIGTEGKAMLEKKGVKTRSLDRVLKIIESKI